MFQARTPFLWVRLGTGYSPMGWARVQYIFSTGSGWVRAEIYWSGLGVG